MLRTLIALTTRLAILVGATVATAQTTRTTAPAQATAPTKSTTTTQTTAPTTSSNQGAYDKLSLGNQKIAQALYDAQVKPSGTTSGTTSSTSSTQPTPYTLDTIAAMKQHKGWGEVFKEMKASGQLPPDVKNLGQLVSGRYQSGMSSGTTITSGSGRSQVVGKPEYGNKSGKGPMDSGDAPSSYGRGSDSSGSGHVYGYGHGDSSGSSAGMGHSGMSQGGGRGK